MFARPMDPSSSGKFTLCSVQLHLTRRAVEDCPEQEAARYFGVDETGPSRHEQVDQGAGHQDIHIVVTSTQPAGRLKALRSKEVAGYAAPEEVASNIEDLCKLIE